MTGASSGIGEAFARRLAADAHNLILVARREDRLQTLAEDLSRAHGVRAEVLAADLATDEGIARVSEDLTSGPPLTMLVSAAGFGTRTELVDLPVEVLDRMVRLHVMASVRLTRAALPRMVERQRGGIIHVSSMAALFTSSLYTTYGATKAFLNSFCEGLALEVAPKGVRVQACLCGLTRTEFLSHPEFSEFSYQQVPERFWMSPAQVASESLRALADGGPVLFIPGALNRAFVDVLRTPVLGALTRAAIDRLGGRNLY